MDSFLAVLFFFGVLIGLGIIVSTYLYKRGAIGMRRFRLRRSSPSSVELVPVESEPAASGLPVEVEESDIIDVPESF
jgi:hypothetical protein